MSLWNFIVGRRLVRDGVLAFALLALSSGSHEVCAQTPRVQFDMPYLVSARDVTPAAFRQLNPQEKLVEVRFPISSFLAAGDAADLTQIVYRIEGPQGKFAVADFLPKTTLETKYAGNLNVEFLSDHEANLHIDLAGHYQWLTGFTANAKYYDKEYSQVKGELLPPLEAVAASGTTQRQRGVYFKLRGSTRTWLEGEKEFATVLRVPRDWQADYVVVRCEAEGVRRSFLRQFDERLTVGRRDFVVALYLEGDEQGRGAALELTRTESNLRRVVSEAAANPAQRPSGSRSQAPWSLPERTTMSADWFTKLVVSPATEIPRQLPAAVREAASDFIAAKTRIPSGGVSR